jgi:protein TonB
MQREAGIRLVLALALSVAVHLSLIYGIAVGPGELAPARTIVARLASEAVAARRVPEARRAQREATLPVASGDRGQAAEFKATEPQTVREAASLARPEESALPHVDVPLIVDPAWYAANDLDLYPRPVTPVDPEYPESAAGISGAVSLLLKIDEFGAVQEVTVVNAEPAGYFEDSASQAFKAAHFSPAQRDGRPVRSRIVVKVRFEPQVQASAVR